MANALEGDIWLADGHAGPLALAQVSMLQVIHETGSISAAARQLNISYKTAWERLERMNNLARAPLVSRCAGGSQGGGTRLTSYGQRILDGYLQLKQEHNGFMSSVSSRLGSFDELADFVRTSRVMTSARNQFSGVVESISEGTVNAEVTLRLSDSLRLVAVITEQSRSELDLKPDRSLLALIKASAVLLAVGQQPHTSARNSFAGTIKRIDQGPVSADVTLDIGDDKSIAAVITSVSADQLKLEIGQPAWAFFKASNVILMGY
jgi:molybdate transport system regulatory protein